MIIDDLRKLQKLIRKYAKVLPIKVEVIKVNISSTFMPRSRCNHCGTGPAFYFYSRNPYIYNEVSAKITASNLFNKWIKRMAGDWYLKEMPSSFISVKDHKYAPKYYYVPAIYSKRGLPIDKENLLEMVCCDCGVTTWAFSRKAVKNRPEITNRKGRYNYPQKFEY